jgi:tetratricopeptide (TPR) repeat protein
MFLIQAYIYILSICRYTCLYVSYTEDIFSMEKRIKELEEENTILRKRLEILPSDKPKEWNQRWQIILDFIKENSGTNKEEIIKKLAREKKGSRVTVLNDIKYLTDSGFIVSRKADKNSSTFNLYINEIELEKLIDIHERFEKFFIDLIEKIRPKIFNDELFLMQHDHPDQEKLMLIHEILLIYVHFLAMNMIHAIFNWPTIIKDDDKRIKLNSILFAKLQKLHLSVSDALSYTSKKYPGRMGIPIEQNTIVHWFKLTPSSLKSSMESAKKFEIVKEMEKVLEITWGVSHTFLPFARVLFEKDGYKEGHDVQKWKKQSWRPVNWKEAVKYYEKGFLDSELEDIVNKGVKLMDSANPKEVIKYFDQVLEVDPENINALNNKGYLLNIQGKYDDALVYLDKALLIDPNFIPALVNKGNSLCYRGKYDEAMNYYDKVLEMDYKNFNALNNKGYALLTIGDFAKAQKYLDKALKIEPENPLVIYNKGFFYEKKRDYKEALKWYNKLLKIKPNHTNALNAKGRVLCEIDKEDEAIPFFDKVLDLDPVNIDGLTNKGVYLLKHSENEKDFEEALRCFDKVLSINPEHFEALNNKAGCILRFKKSDKDIDEAIQYFDKALSIRPSDIGVLLNKGIAYNYRRKYDYSINCFDEILKRLPNHKIALLFKAETLFDMEKYKEAIEYFDKVISLDTSNERAKEGVMKAKENLKIQKDSSSLMF